MRRNRRLGANFERLETRRLMTVDIDGDGTVGIRDFLILSRDFGETTFDFGSGADIDGDGTVGTSDFVILSANFGASMVDFEPVRVLEPTNPSPQEAVVRSAEDWQALQESAAPENDPIEPPVNFQESMLAYVSVGETNLGQGMDIVWIASRDDGIEVAYRRWIGGPAPPPGTQITNAMVSLPASDLPVRFRKLETIAFP